MTYKQSLLLFCLFGFGVISYATPPRPRLIVPVVDADSGQLYGAWSDPDWLSAQKTDALITKDLMFRAYAKNGVFLKQTALSPVQTSETCSNPTYRPRNKALTFPKSATFIGASWDAAPRKPLIIKPKSLVYRNQVSIWLRNQGIHDPKPVLSQLWRIDLEGDGRDEVFITASRSRGSATSAVAGDYSILLMRKLTGNNTVITVPIKSDTFLKDCIAECAPMTHELFGAFDIDGDGRLEIIIKSFGYESITQTIYSVNDTDLVKRLEWFCGS